MSFFLGFSAATAFWLFVRRWEDKRIDRDIEARMMALDRERVARIWDRYSGRTYDDATRIARAPDWNDP